MVSYDEVIKSQEYQDYLKIFDPEDREKAEQGIREWFAADAAVERLFKRERERQELKYEKLSR